MRGGDETCAAHREVTSVAFKSKGISRLYRKPFSHSPHTPHLVMSWFIYCLGVCLWACVYVYVQYVYFCICWCIYVCMYIHNFLIFLMYFLWIVSPWEAGKCKCNDRCFLYDIQLVPVFYLQTITLGKLWSLLSSGPDCIQNIIIIVMSCDCDSYQFGGWGMGLGLQPHNGILIQRHTEVLGKYCHTNISSGAAKCWNYLSLA